MCFKCVVRCVILYIEAFSGLQLALQVFGKTLADIHCNSEPI